ncbi:TetR/AcrR family transcriptional regulator [Burkholderia plantarii]|uniref:Transcriptional regulator, TetR family n=1 Tax=Burkholderia plantarii TaxID=41899 RepID=A0A0B6RZM9_BURPL|nr:TetR/AcrR family transcriptional regulator [Burkholderia plantarii]AJK47629.1 transcriptional regulator, TetR family [Burkholderia plantarii]
MRYTAEHKQETRARILAAAAQLFRREGYEGAGISGLTEAAGVTNGAFYGHFKSKGDAFRTIVQLGLEQLRGGVASLKQQHGSRWLKRFVEFYLGTKRTCDLGQACALQSLSPEVMRAEEPIRAAYEEELRRLIDEVAGGLPHGKPGERQDAAIATLALLAGGVTLARAVADPQLSERIAKAVSRAALELAPREP